LLNFIEEEGLYQPNEDQFIFYIFFDKQWEVLQYAEQNHAFKLVLDLNTVEEETNPEITFISNNGTAQSNLVTNKIINVKATVNMDYLGNKDEIVTISTVKYFAR
jgi:hypothetical protein